jgi:uncharacterized protein (DUF1684 family)
MRIITIATIPTTTHDGKRAKIPEGVEVQFTKNGKARCLMQICRRDGKWSDPMFNTAQATQADIGRFINILI